MDALKNAMNGAGVREDTKSIAYTRYSAGEDEVYIRERHDAPS